MEVVVFDELVEVDREELERDDKVVPENAVILYLNDVILIFLVLFLEVLEDAKLDTCLMLVSLLIFDNLHGNDFSCFVVQALQSLAKAAPSKEVKHFESVVDVIFEHNVVVSILVVVAIVVQLCRCHTLDLDSIKAQEVYFLKVEQLCFLKVCYSVFIQLQSLAHCERELRSLFLCLVRRYLSVLLMTELLSLLSSEEGVFEKGICWHVAFWRFLLNCRRSVLRKIACLVLVKRSQLGRLMLWVVLLLGIRLFYNTVVFLFIRLCPRLIKFVLVDSADYITHILCLELVLVLPPFETTCNFFVEKIVSLQRQWTLRSYGEPLFFF